MIFLELFVTFFKIGLFGFGGGNAILSLIQGDVVTARGWLSVTEFTDVVAISQVTPGPIGINAATFVGYTAVLNAGYGTGWAVLGSLVASVGTLMPSFIIMILVSRFLLRYCDHPSVKSVLGLLRKLVIGLIASAALLLLTEENFGNPTTETLRFAVSVVLFLFAFVAINRWKMNPILIVLITGAAGGIIYGLV